MILVAAFIASFIFICTRGWVVGNFFGLLALLLYVVELVK